MNALYTERVNFFNKVVKVFKHEKISDLVVAHRLDKKIFKKLEKSASKYVSISKKFKFTNRTPNGRLAPKKQNEKYFNDFAQAYFEMLQYLKIDKKLKNYLVPVIRYKKGKIDSLNKKNNSRSELPHADCWAGWTQDCLLFLLPLLGDFQNNKVRLFEVPKDIKKNWFKKKQFLDANKKIKKKLIPIKDHYKKGYLYVADISVPHVTIRNQNSKYRVSVDSALMFKSFKIKKKSKNLTAYISSKDNFISIKKAKHLNKKFILKCPYNMGEFEITNGIKSKPVYKISSK